MTFLHSHAISQYKIVIRLLQLSTKGLSYLADHLCVGVHLAKGLQVNFASEAGLKRN